MAKTPSVTLHDFFTGPAIEAHPEERLLAIFKKALELGNMPYDISNGWPANVHSLALVIADHAHEAAKAIDANDAMTAMIHGYRVGEYCQKISTLLAVNDHLTQKVKTLAGQIKGGEKGSKHLKDDAEETRRQVVELWERLKDTPERNRAAIIAKRIEKTEQIVRDHIRKAGLRKAKME